MTPKCPDCKHDQEDCSCSETIESLRQQLATALAACKVKDAFLHMATTEIRWSGDPMYEAACKALAATDDMKEEGK